MDKISLIAKLTVDESKTAEFEQALADLIVKAEEEDGLLLYAANADKKNPGVYYFYELYNDKGALEVHGKGEQMSAGMAAMGAFLTAKPELTFLQPVVAKGIDL